MPPPFLPSTQTPRPPPPPNTTRWPANFLCLVDTYDTLRSGVPNFLAVALALSDLGYTPVGIRLDSGDLAYLSKRIRQTFREVAAAQGKPGLERLKIVASNDINEDVLYALAKQGHEIDAFGVGTHLVTCMAQPALGCVYKLVEIDGQPRIKLSNEVGKVTLPSRKSLYRLSNHSGGASGPAVPMLAMLACAHTPTRGCACMRACVQPSYPIHPCTPTNPAVALVDIMLKEGEPAPAPGQRLLCRHPFDPKKRAYVTPAAVTPLLHLVWDGAKGGIQPGALQTLEASRAHVLGQLRGIREDILRHLNPTPYKVSVSESLHSLLHTLWEHEAPIGVL